MVEGHFAYQVKGIDVLHKKIVLFPKKDFVEFRLNLEKNGHFAYSFFVVHRKRMVDIAIGSA